jgi:hypothetical protein
MASIGFQVGCNTTWSGGKFPCQFPSLAPDLRAVTQIHCCLQISRKIFCFSGRHLHFPVSSFVGACTRDARKSPSNQIIRSRDKTLFPVLWCHSDPTTPQHLPPLDRAGPMGSVPSAAAFFRCREVSVGSDRPLFGLLFFSLLTAHMPACSYGAGCQNQNRKFRSRDEGYTYSCRLGYIFLWSLNLFRTRKTLASKSSHPRSIVL